IGGIISFFKRLF
nr:RecName: Full=Grammistin Gs B [Grammistes sexlineatus]